MSQRTEARRVVPRYMPAPPDTNGKPPMLSLVAAGLGALSAIVTTASVGLFLWDAAAATPIIQRAAPLLVAAGLGAVIAGGIILVKNKRSGFTMEGSQWASPGIVAGLLLMLAAVFLPLVHALSMLIDQSR